MTEAISKIMADFGAAVEHLLAGQEQEILRLRARVRELEAQAMPVAAVPEADDLRRIYGIGPVLEKRLRDLGICRFEQIGRWGDLEIEDYQAQLPEYPGRIRREAWVKSARDEYRKKYKRALL